MNLSPFIDIIEDLNRDLSPDQRYERLIQTIQRAIPCDAIALLKLEGDYLLPVAVLGLKPEAMARRYQIAHHPRLASILAASQLLRFEADSNLPDPYDGLVDDCEELEVHDCMGSVININGKPWGVLTLDAMKTGSFDSLDAIETRAYIAAVAAVIKTSQHIEAIEARAEHNFKVAQHLIAADTAQPIIGKSKAITTLINEINIVASSDLSVLITGETGVGKELVAKRIHQQSRRALKPLVQINCAALPENIIESELFGHVKGGFTGATENRTGRFELANGGTLFLDEVGELPLPAQAKLLRALQSGEIQRVGSDKVISVDVRIIAATNRKLQIEVKEGRFRADLYHRLSVYPLPVPPLVEREHDVLLLAGYFLEKIQHQLGVDKLRLSQPAANQLLQYDWPGNVRELEHLLSRSALKAIRKQHGSNKPNKHNKIVSIDTEHLGLAFVESKVQKPDINALHPVSILPNDNESSLREAMDDFQLILIKQTLQNNKGNISATARALKVDRSNLTRIMKRLAIDL